jgi:hypothetical protein
MCGTIVTTLVPECKAQDIEVENCSPYPNFSSYERELPIEPGSRSEFLQLFKIEEFR